MQNCLLKFRLLENFLIFRLIIFNFSRFFPFDLDLVARFISASEDNMKEYDALINIFLIVPDYALSHALSALILTFVKNHEPNSHLTNG